MRSRAALLITCTSPTSVAPRISRVRAWGLAAALLDDPLLAHCRRADRIVDDVAGLLDLRGSIRADVHVLHTGDDWVFTLDFAALLDGPLLDDLALFHMCLLAVSV